MWWIKSKINSIFNLKKIIVGIYSWNYIVLAIYSVFFCKKLRLITYVKVSVEHMLEIVKKKK